MIDPRAFLPLVLSLEEIRRLLPHRPPLLLIDGATAFAKAPPALRAHRNISAEEPVLAGHFPGEAMWPGAYTIEGLAQACALLGALETSDAALPPGRASTGAVGALVAVDVKLTRPVLPGQRLEYLVSRTHAIGAIHRFDVEAFVGMHTVAKGTLTIALRGEG